MRAGQIPRPRGRAMRAHENRWAHENGLDAFPAPFREDVARRVPDRDRDGPVRGVLDIPGEDLIEVVGGCRDEAALERLCELYPGLDLGDIGITEFRDDHPEMLTAVQLRLWSAGHPAERVSPALYVNEAPCRGPAGCEATLRYALPAGMPLTILGPGGYLNVIKGRTDPPRRYW